MRILWVKVGGLWPANSGGRIRSYQTINELSARHSVTVLTTHAADTEARDLRVQLPRCAEVSSFHHSPAKRGSARFVSSLVRSWLSPLPIDLWRWQVPELRAAATAALSSGRFDLCIADFLVAMPNLTRTSPVPMVLFEHNVEFQIWKRLAAGVTTWQRPLAELEWRKLRRYERRACAIASRTLAVSEPDRALLASIAPSGTVRAVPTGVDTRYFAPSGGPESDLSLTFVGSMDWYPNEDAALHFIEATLPLIRSEVPDCTLTIVGRNPSDRLRSAADRAGVHVTGTVADVRPYVSETAVLVVPLRIGGGTRLKILEGLAMGKAIVSSTIGAEGLPIVPGEHYIRADDPSAFAREVTALLHDPARRHALGGAGRDLVTSRFSWEQVARVFESQCLEALAKDPG